MRINACADDTTGVVIAQVQHSRLSLRGLFCVAEILMKREELVGG